MIPRELQATPQWLVSGNNKVPISPRTGTAADVRNRDLYVTYEEAVAYAKERSFDVGFVLTPEDPFTAIDLDSADATAEQQARHQKIFEAFPTYAELSRSGKGVHIWCYGKVPRGVRRDRVEVYSDHRYMISTGRALKDVPIADCQSLLDILFEEMGRVGEQGQIDLEEIEELIPDADLFEMATRAANAEKFEQLCRGEWQEDYPSQSEADYALMNMLCFYTRSNSQAKRLFRYSALGRRDKAQREAYLDTMIRKIRAEELPLIDFSHVGNGNGTSNGAGAGGNHAPPVAVKADITEGGGEVVAAISDFSYPPGFVGELAQYIYDSSIRPVKEVSVAAALALSSGIVGRQFNISGMGLNQYIILVAKTAVGKEGADSGIERLMEAVRNNGMPVIDQFRGPAGFASGQAVVRALDEKVCFFSILGEFGMTLQILSASNVQGSTLYYRRALLDLYGKSGQGKVLYSTAYSDKEKNTKTLHSPALTLLGETTPETFYGGLEEQHIAEGLVPRFLVIEYKGERPDSNPRAFTVPSDELVKRLTDTTEVVLRMMSNNSWQVMELEPDAAKLVAEFDKKCDVYVRRNSDGGLRQLWSRGHQKVLRLAGTLAAMDRPHSAVVTREEAAWAIWLVERDINAMIARFTEGDVGGSDSKQRSVVRKLLQKYLIEGDDASLLQHRIVPYRFLLQRTANLAAFRNSYGGQKGAATRALNDCLASMVDSGELVEVSKLNAQQNFNTRQRLYQVPIE